MQSPVALAPSRNAHRFSALIAHATFVPTGAITVMIGPLLPILSARWGLNDTRAGYLITAQFMGAFLSTVSTSAIVPRWGFRYTIAAGQILMATGAVTLMAGSFATAVISVLCYGIGIGFTIPTVNLIIAEENTVRRSSALNLLNFSWSAGAVACPLVLSWLPSAAIPTFLRSIAVTLILLALLGLLFALQEWRSETSGDRTQSEPWFRYVANPTVIVLGAIFFLYVGTENGLSAWLASFAKREGSTQGDAWAAVPSYFYAAMLLGRVLAPMSLRRWGDRAQSRASLGLAIVSVAGLLLSHSSGTIAVCAFFTGLGFSTLYPIAIGLLASAFGSSAPTIGGLMFALSTLGGASVPWLVGLASTESGSLRMALAIPFVGCWLMLFLYSSPRLRLNNN